MAVSIATLYELTYGLATFEKTKKDDDNLIASTAISQGAILVSNDAIFGDILDYEFGLEFEEWV